MIAQEQAMDQVLESHAFMQDRVSVTWERSSRATVVPIFTGNIKVQMDHVDQLAECLKQKELTAKIF